MKNKQRIINGFIILGIVLSMFIFYRNIPFWATNTWSSIFIFGLSMFVLGMNKKVQKFLHHIIHVKFNSLRSLNLT